MNKKKYKINYCYNLPYKKKNLEGGGNSKSPMMILFKPEWCGACKMYEESWNQLQSLMKKSNIKFTSIDCEQNREIANKYNIEYYPTLIFKNGNKIEKYEGSRRPIDVKNYLEKKKVEI